MHVIGSFFVCVEVDAEIDWLVVVERAQEPFMKAQIANYFTEPPFVKRFHLTAERFVGRIVGGGDPHRRIDN
jgi:hypothetical protein